MLKKISVEAGIIIIIAVFAAILYNAFSPTGLPFFKKDQAEMMISDSLLFGNSKTDDDTLQLTTEEPTVEKPELVIDSSLKEKVKPEIINQLQNEDSLKQANRTILLEDNKTDKNSEFKIVSFDQMKKIVSSPLFFIIDARRPEDFAKGHIAGSINIFPYLEESEYISKILSIPKDKTIIIYCDGGTCDLSHEVAKTLTGNFAFHKVFIYQDGWEEWSRKYK